MNQLVEYGLLTTYEVRQLNKAGISTCRDLVEQTRDPNSCQDLWQQVSIVSSRLLPARAAANLLAMEGPGAFVAERVATDTHWGNANLENDDTRELLEFVASADRQALIEWLATELKKAKEPEEQGSRRTQLRVLGIVALFCLGLLAWAVFELRGQLFPPHTGEVAQQLILSLQQSLTTAYLFCILFILGGVVLAIFLFGKASDVSEWLIGKLGSWFLSSRDRIVVAEATLRLPEWVQKVVDIIDRSQLFLVILALLLALGLGIAAATNIMPMILGAAAILVMGGAYLFLFSMKVLGFKRIGTAWARQVRAHYASYIVVEFLIKSILVIAVLLLGAVALIQGLFPAVVDWAVDWSQDSEAKFRLAVNESAAEIDTSTDLLAWGQEHVSGWQTSLIDEVKGTGGLLQQMFYVLNRSYLGILLAIAIAEFLYINAARGISSLVIWVGSFLASEFVPDWLDQVLNLAPATIQVSILALTTSAIVAITTDLVLESAENRDARECPQCWILADAGNAYCSACGHALHAESASCMETSETAAKREARATLPQVAVQDSMILAYNSNSTSSADASDRTMNAFPPVASLPRNKNLKE